ncbi:MAG: hypothetical protein IMZ53_17105 [Thermoplasmata archaeon]|nr:hypothetical protein [Thermoplasmata archaeon]MBE3142292.1 hypothetical protein [Thermoplasmata archaeon]
MLASDIDPVRYPVAHRFMTQHPGWSVDQAISYLEGLDAELSKTSS